MESLTELLRPFAEEAGLRAQEFEEQGFISQDFADRLAETGLFRLCNVSDLGGLDGSAMDYARVTEMMAEQDASAAWVLFIGITSALSHTNLNPEEIKAVFKRGRAITAGVFAPMGRAIPTVQDGEEGFLLSGQCNGGPVFEIQALSPPVGSWWMKQVIC